jgi:hypothetical protein
VDPSQALSRLALVQLVLYQQKWLGVGREFKQAVWVLDNYNTLHTNIINPLEYNGHYRFAIELNGLMIQELTIDPKSRFWIDGEYETSPFTNAIATNPLTPDECYKPTRTIHKDDIKRMILVALHYHDYPELRGKTADDIAEQIFNNGIKLETNDKKIKEVRHPFI